jgi:hypothetical protein
MSAELHEEPHMFAIAGEQYRPLALPALSCIVQQSCAQLLFPERAVPNTAFAASRC